MEIKELNGRKLKKDLEAGIVRKTYHNKHVDGSGNFGFIIRRGNDGQYWYRIDGVYDKNGRITHLDFSDYAGYYKHNLLGMLFIEDRLIRYKDIIAEIKTIIETIENLQEVTQ